MVVKKTKIILLACFLVGICAVLLVIIAGIFIGSLNNQNRDKVATEALSYARAECLKNGRGQQVCNNLTVEVTPPPDWGAQDYLVYVYNTNREMFDSSMAIQIKDGHPKVVDFGITKFEE